MHRLQRTTNALSLTTLRNDHVGTHIMIKDLLEAFRYFVL